MDDCTNALAQIPEQQTDLNDTTQRNEFVKQRRMRLKLLIRRGSAYCQLGMFGEAKADYGFVVTQTPQDEALRRDLARISIMNECGKLKDEADALFGQGQRKEAIEVYSKALDLDPSFISCSSNRAACYLAIGDAESCVADCTLTLNVLQVCLTVPYDTRVTPLLRLTTLEHRPQLVK